MWHFNECNHLPAVYGDLIRCRSSLQIPLPATHPYTHAQLRIWLLGASSFPLLRSHPTLAPALFTKGLFPSLSYLIGRWAQSSVFHNEIPGGERDSMKSRGASIMEEKSSWLMASVTRSEKKPVEYSIFQPRPHLPTSPLCISLTPLSPHPAPLFISQLPFTVH